jgi:hypothetical protein
MPKCSKRSTRRRAVSATSPCPRPRSIKQNSSSSFRTWTEKGGEAEFAAAAAGKVANCSGITYKTPANISESLDLDWSQVFGGKPFVGGGAYPLCALTYVLAFHGYKAAGFTLGDELTVHDYLAEYVVQKAGQEAINGSYYSALRNGAKAEFDVAGLARK